MSEQRWFIKYKTAVGFTYCVMHDDYWPQDVKFIYRHELPKEFWDIGIDKYIDFFEHGIKPRIKL